MIVNDFDIPHFFEEILDPNKSTLTNLLLIILKDKTIIHHCNLSRFTEYLRIQINFEITILSTFFPHGY